MGYPSPAVVGYTPSFNCSRIHTWHNPSLVTVRYTQSFSSCIQIQQSFSNCSQIQQSFSNCSQIQQSFSNCSQILQSFSNCMECPIPKTVFRSVSIQVQLNQELKVKTNTIININLDTTQSVFSGTCPTATTQSETQGSWIRLSLYFQVYVLKI